MKRMMLNNGPYNTLDMDDYSGGRCKSAGIGISRSDGVYVSKILKARQVRSIYNWSKRWLDEHTKYGS